MLIELVRTLHRHAPARAADAPSGAAADAEPASALPPGAWDVVRDLASRLDSEIVRPYRRLRDIDAVRARWDDWVGWFGPLFEELVARMGGVFRAAPPPGVDELNATAADALDDLREAIRSRVDDDLVETLDAALATVAAAERLRAHGGDGTLGAAPEALRQRARAAAVGFALAFLLLHADLDDDGDGNGDGERDAWPTTFLVNRAKRMASVYYVAIRESLARRAP